MDRVYWGIDPGSNGGLAIINPKGEPLAFHSLPETESETFELISKLAGQRRLAMEPMLAVIEWINPAFFGSGKASMSKLYGSYMSLRMALIASGLPFAAIQAAKWHKGLRIKPRAKTESDTMFKNRLKRTAEERFPDIIVTLSTADALLIAEYARLYQPQPNRV